MNMRMTFRWYGEDDPVTLDNIELIPCMDGIVSAVYDQPVGSVWTEASLAKLNRQAAPPDHKYQLVERARVR